jgi:hypothetical protein
MIRPTSKNRPALFLNDFQVFKGKCENTMRPFGRPVSATHEAQLLIRDDRGKLPVGALALYAIHQRSENRITQIIEHRRAIAMPVRPSRKVSLSPVLKAAA